MTSASKKRAQRERAAATGGRNSSPTDPVESPSARMSHEKTPSPGFDGNRDPSEARVRAGSNAGSSSSARVSEPTLAMTTTTTTNVMNKNVDVGFFGASLMAGYNAPTNLPPRPKEKNQSGIPINVKLNTWDVVKFPIKPVYQYDVVIGKGEEKRGLIKTIWETNAVKNKFGAWCIFDGNKLAWSCDRFDDARIEVDLDVERGREPREGRPDRHAVVLRRTKTVDFASLEAYLSRKTNMNNGVLEATNFLDHLLREQPSRLYYQVRRNFFSARQQRFNLGAGVEAFKGTHASIRMVLGNQGPCPSINVDVANSAFWHARQLTRVACEFFGVNGPQDLYRIKPFQWEKLRILKGTRMAVMIRMPPDNSDGYSVHTMFRDCREVIFANFSPKTAKTLKFHDTNLNKEVNVVQYFSMKYNVTVHWTDLPLVQTTKKDVYYPMEALFIKPGQKFNHKLTDLQTKEMIKFAVTEPQQRWQDIENTLKYLDWGNDKFLAQYGFQVSKQPTVVQACLMPNPQIKFGQKMLNPGTKGRWDLRGQRFLESNTKPLKAWGAAVMPGRMAPAIGQVARFMDLLVDTYGRHGGKIETRKPVVIMGSEDASKCVEELYDAIKQSSKTEPQLLIFVVNNREASFYNRLKKSSDCRYGVASQVLQGIQVSKCNAQYASNVCLKINAKLGGCTTHSVGPTSKGEFFQKPTMIIGADVSHAGAERPMSIAAMSMSWDKHAVKYSANVQGNGIREEIISKTVLSEILESLYKGWVANVGRGAHPYHVFYFRDGVAEGQYQQVLDTEVKGMRELFESWGGKPLFTILVASKRHHVRFFPEPKSADPKGNPQPGTLVETGVTHPFEYDFYLCAHSAIKGTARPVHYYVLMDEAHVPKNKLQSMIYESSYQYVRSTTPVSLIPAVYYAHLAAYRAGAHQRLEAPPGHEQAKGLSAGGSGVATSGRKSDKDLPREQLIPIAQSQGLHQRMWFV